MTIKTYVNSKPHGGLCCGIRHIYDIYINKFGYKNLVRTPEEVDAVIRRIKDIENQSVGAGGSNLTFEIVLTDEQLEESYNLLHVKLLEHGYAKSFRAQNRNSYNWINIYHKAGSIGE